jgi:hypothetical protein
MLECCFLERLFPPLPNIAEYKEALRFPIKESASA